MVHKVAKGAAGSRVQQAVKGRIARYAGEAEMTKIWEVNEETLKRMEKAEKEREQLEQQVFHLKQLLDHYREREKHAAELLRDENSTGESWIVQRD